MQAIQVKEAGASDQLHLTEVDRPSIGDHDLLVRVKATGVNRLDTVHRQLGTGNFPALGVETAGVVAEAGVKSKFKPGSRVFGLTTTGSYSDYAIIPDDWAMEIPEDWTFIEAAAIPEVFLTAFQTLFTIGKLSTDECVLIHAGASGVGTAAIQLAKQVADAQVIVTAGSQEKLDFCRELGADYVINYKEADFAEEIEKITEGKGVNLVLDFIGASYWQKNIDSLGVDGRLVLIGTLGGVKVDQVNLRDIMGKRLQITGTLLSPRSYQYKANLVADFQARVGQLLAQKEIKPIIDKVFPLKDAKEAHDYMEASKNIGKLILTVDAN
ncbi:NAD(P)H-quinone oxidoreductase [Aerococcus kribbianus]|uniref:NAD(P)H-quinone oxidoreductase n=1 Tax=Aerococcus kribbianus TaxID=2999064 RepID=A0A9X3FPG6_9LACT|nr:MULTISPECIES: NAD(P)H-quinone oxidoreductase [unclassified Aerococcus]MCZ0718099.1 NAD(P)H-quinone oxidoreductase [Aerococcus sp. YH-aer221]MCZ0726332.1 NAD(P)H-quinone oxidoreductase [Aerococcus sp. YH-aer222]